MPRGPSLQSSASHQTRRQDRQRLQQCDTQQRLLRGATFSCTDSATLTEALMLKRAYRRFQQFMLPMTSGLSATNVETIVDGADHLQVELENWSRDSGAGTLWDLVATCLIARHRAPNVCFEIGTGHGRTSHHLALNTPAKTRIYTLDISAETIVGCVFRDRPTASKISQLTGDSSSFDFGPWAGRVDLVFIDGDHGYEGARWDTERAFEMLAPGGCVLWDDFTPGWPGVIKAVKRHPRSNEFQRIVGTKLAYYCC